jgi:FkbM family methyltransferase
MIYKEFLIKSYNWFLYKAGKLKPVYFKSFSQCGEDMIARFYLYQNKGYYVDIGAYHPKKISNTYYFYKKGWRGINVDGNRKSINLFDRMRPNDINVHCCVGNSEEDSTVEFYMFERSELNTIKKELLPDIFKYHKQKPIAVEKIPFRKLASILNEYKPSVTPIDLLSIDTEGADEEILLSNDWKSYRPKVIIVEKHCTIYDFIKTNLHQYLLEQCYTLGGYSRHSYIFHDSNYNEF